LDLLVKKGFYPSLLNSYVFHDIVSSINYSLTVLLISKKQLINIPRLPPSTRGQLHPQPHNGKIWNLTRKINKFDTIAGAMDRDRSDPKHGGLYDAFNSSLISPYKEELKLWLDHAFESSVLNDIYTNNTSGYDDRSVIYNEHLFRTYFKRAITSCN